MGRQNVPWWALWRDPEMEPGWGGGGGSHWNTVPLGDVTKAAHTRPSLQSQLPLPARHKCEAGHIFEGPDYNDKSQC